MCALYQSAYVGCHYLRGLHVNVLDAALGKLS
jgi:hypothetical protein